MIQLNLFCKREGKWAEIHYVQLFFFLKEHQNGWNNVREVLKP
jgi:hypothetical protein